MADLFPLGQAAFGNRRRPDPPPGFGPRQFLPSSCQGLVTPFTFLHSQANGSLIFLFIRGFSPQQGGLFCLITNSLGNHWRMLHSFIPFKQIHSLRSRESWSLSTRAMHEFFEILRLGNKHPDMLKRQEKETNFVPGCRHPPMCWLIA